MWVDGYWDVSWTDGYWEESAVDGYWEEVWNDGNWEEVWVDGYEDEEGNWHDGYSDWNWVDGYSDWNWVDGHSEWNWVEGHEEWNWVEGRWDEQSVDGYWDQEWVEPSEQPVWVEGYNVDVWVDGYWTLVWGPWSVEVFVPGHWEGPWTWTGHEVLGDWYWSDWAPDPGTVLEGVAFTQERPGVRSKVTWETNEAGDIQNFFSGPDYTAETRPAIGTKPPTWTAFDEPGAWYYSAWSPDPAEKPCGQTFTQSRTPRRDHRVGERNELGAERNVTTYTEDGQAETQNATGTQGCPPGGGGGGGSLLITSASSASTAIGISFSYQITTNFSPNLYGATGLPDGLSIDTASGLITGAATVDGTFTVALNASNGTQLATNTLQLTIVNGRPVFASASISFSMIAGETYARGLSWTGTGITNHEFTWLTPAPRYFSYTFSPTTSSAEIGFTVTPTSPGTYSFRVNASNAAGGDPTTITLNVADFPRLQSADLSLPGGVLPSQLSIPAKHWALRNTGANLGTTWAGLLNFDLGVKPIWDAGNAGSHEIKVLVLDTGVQDGHPALRIADRTNTHNDDRISNPSGLPYPQYAVPSDSASYMSGRADEPNWLRAIADAHGTMVAGAVAGLYLKAGDPLDKTAIGSAPGVSILSARIFGHDEHGILLNVYSTSIIDAMNWGIQQGARISVSSFTTGVDLGSIEDAFANARGLSYTRSLWISPYLGTREGADMLHFVASGNAALNPDYVPILGHPANLWMNLAVGAVDGQGRRAGFSSYGPGLSLVAPGEAVITGNPTWFPRSPSESAKSLGFIEDPTQRWAYQNASVKSGEDSFPAEHFWGATYTVVTGELIGGGDGGTQNTAWRDKIVIIDRTPNGISFGEKVANAEASGARGCIIANTEDALIAPGPLPAWSTIPVLGVRKPAGDTVKTRIGQNVTLDRTYGWAANPNRGTSFAAPFSAGVAALIMSRNPKWTGAMVESRLLTSVNRPPSWGPSYSNEHGFGMPDARLALTPGLMELVNLATRGTMNVGAGQPLIMGFVVTEPPGQTGQKKRMLVRAAGPALSGFDIASALSDPTITVRDANGAVVATNTRWGTADAEDLAAVVDAIKHTGAFPFADGSADSALVCELAAGAYTAVISSAGDHAGIVLGEVYDAAGADPSTAQIANLSSRGYVGTDQSLIIGSFILDGSTRRSVLVRAVGPSLPNVDGKLSDPYLVLKKKQGDGSWQIVASNDNWGSAVNSEEIKGMSTVFGAFAFTEGSADAAVLLVLEPGVYSAEVSGVNDATGVALVEIYPALD